MNLVNYLSKIFEHLDIILILLVTIIAPLFAAFIIYKFSYAISNYDFVRRRMSKRKTIALLVIEKDGKILFRKKKGLSPGREEYKNTWVLPGGEVDLDKQIKNSIKLSTTTSIPLHIWATAYAQSQIGIKVSCLDEHDTHCFSGSYVGGIRMGYPPGRIVIFCGKISDADGNTKNVIKKIFNNEVDDKKFFSKSEIEKMPEYFHPFYIKHLEAIASLRTKIEKERKGKKALNNGIVEELGIHISKQEQ